MKANELTDGIYVYFNCFDGSKIIVRVTGFKDGVVYGVSEHGAHWCQISKIEPIPLTQEILEKNFESKRNIFGLQTYILDKNFSLEDRRARFCLVRTCNDYTDSKFVVCDIMYVHQLQHALRLCGIEKEIEL